MDRDRLSRSREAFNLLASRARSSVISQLPTSSPVSDRTFEIAPEHATHTCMMSNLRFPLVPPPFFHPTGPEESFQQTRMSKPVDTNYGGTGILDSGDKREGSHPSRNESKRPRLSDEHLKALFDAWVQERGRKYSCEAERAMRFEAFARRARVVFEHNDPDSAVMLTDLADRLPGEGCFAPTNSKPVDYSIFDPILV